jgi:hypothetical protein
MPRNLDANPRRNRHFALQMRLARLRQQMNFRVCDSGSGNSRNPHRGNKELRPQTGAKQRAQNPTRNQGQQSTFVAISNSEK